MEQTVLGREALAKHKVGSMKVASMKVARSSQAVAVAGARLRQLKAETGTEQASARDRRK